MYQNMQEREKKKLIQRHTYSIFYDRNDNRWKTYLPDESKKSGRRLIAKRNRIDLENEILLYYSGVEDNAYITNQFPSLEVLFPQWLQYKDSLTNSSSYIKRILVDWNKYYKDSEIIKLPIQDLTYLRLSAWAHNLVKVHHLTKKQYYNATVIMRQCLDFACEPELHIISENPFSRVHIKGNLFNRPEKPQNNSQIFLKDEQEAICKCARYKLSNRPWCATPLLVLLNFQLGLRIGELCAMKWADIEGNYIHIQRMEVLSYHLSEGSGQLLSDGYKVVPYTKSAAGDRRVYLNTTARSILEQIRRINETNGHYDSGYIFLESRKGKRGTSRTFTKYLDSLCECSGVEHKSSHKIRKTYISSLFDQGININTIREQAGHEDEKTSLNNYCFDQNIDLEKERCLENASNHRMFI